VRIQLLYFPDCPHVGAARRALRRCLAAIGSSESFEEVDVSSARAPESLRGWGSPTILVDGIDVGGADEPEGAASCRLYESCGVPSDEQIRGALLGLDRKEVMHD
jgi:glutaredoxin